LSRRDRPKEVMFRGKSNLRGRSDQRSNWVRSGKRVRKRQKKKITTSVEVRRIRGLKTQPHSQEKVQEKPGSDTEKLWCQFRT